MRHLVLPALCAHAFWAPRAEAADQPSADLRRTFAPLSHEAGVSVDPVPVPETGDLTAVMRLSYAFRPVVLRDAQGEISHHVLEHQFTGDVGVSFGLFGRLGLGVDLPLVLGQIGDDLAGDEAATRLVGTRALPATSLGDPGLRAKLAIVLPEIDEQGLARGFALGLDERFTLPLGDEASFIAEGAVTSETRVLADAGFGPISGHVYAGVKLRGDTGAYGCDPDADPDTCVSQYGHQLPLGLGFALHPRAMGIDDDGRVTLFVETRGWLPLTPVAPFESSLPAGWFASLASRFRFDDVALLAGVEMALNDGVGNAPFRAMLGVSFAPRPRDDDGDGVDDAVDRCPTFAEDRDEFEDTDGCPEMDNDGDGVPDAIDRCPVQSGRAGDEAQGCP